MKGAVIVWRDLELKSQKRSDTNLAGQSEAWGGVS